MRNKKKIRKVMIFTVVILTLLLMAACGLIDSPSGGSSVRQVAVGEIIQFGDFEWRVLDVQGEYALLLSEIIVSYRHYHHRYEAVTWETSEIRQYLNDTFFNTFSEADRARIRETTVINNNNPWDFSDWDDGYASAPGGNNTTDRLFLLSIDEVLQYFGDSGMVTEGATMGVNQRRNNPSGFPNPNRIYYWGIMDENNDVRIAVDYGPYYVPRRANWWLRSPGFSPYAAAYVDNQGSILLTGYPVFVPRGQLGDRGLGLRPALWLSR